MNRTAVASLVTAAVLGTAGGTAYAVLSAPDRADRVRDASSPTTSPTTDTGTSAGLFYFLHGTIHDGAAEVDVPGVDADLVIAVERTATGYLVVHHGPGEDEQSAVHVTTDGEAWEIGRLRGGWDVSTDGERMVLDTGDGWAVAVLAEERTEPLDVVDGLGTELPVMTDPLPGIALAATGVVTAWDADGEGQLVLTETDHWTHTALGRPGFTDPVTSPDGTAVVATYPNPDYSPTNPVGSCLAGGAVDGPAGWWSACGTGPASGTPYSADGRWLLTQTTVGDGPPPAELQVRNVLTGAVEHTIDPGGYRLDAEWGPAAGVVQVVTGEDGTAALTLSRCDVATGRCTAQLEAEGNLVLGSR